MFCEAGEGEKKVFIGVMLGPYNSVLSIYTYISDHHSYHVVLFQDCISGILSQEGAKGRKQ